MATENKGSSVGTVLIAFLLGVGGGVAGAVVVPNLIRPYLPDAIVGNAELVHGVVTGKRLESDRLLLTLPTDGGTVLATFTDNIAEIDLMVGIGDSVTFGMDEYQPFVRDPAIARVVTLSSPLDNAVTPVTTDSMTADSTITPEAPGADSSRSTGSTTTQPDSTPTNLR